MHEWSQPNVLTAPSFWGMKAGARLHARVKSRCFLKSFHGIEEQGWPVSIQVWIYALNLFAQTDMDKPVCASKLFSVNESLKFAQAGMFDLSETAEIRLFGLRKPHY